MDNTSSVPPGLEVIASDSVPHQGTAAYPGGQKLWIQTALTTDVTTLVVGRDVGKSVSMLFLVEEESSVCDHNYEFAYIAQTHSEAQKRYLEWLARWQNSGLVVDTYDKDQNRWITLKPWGTSAYTWRGWFWSGGDKALDTLRGSRLDRALVDEGNQISPKIRAVVWPMLTSRGGKKYVAGTPSRKGPGYAWFKDSFLRGKKAMEGFRSFNAPSECSPFNMPPFKPEGYMLRKRMEFRSVLEPDVKTIEEREEFDGEFIDDLGQVFCNIDAVCALPVDHTEDAGCLFVGAEPEKGEQYLIGADWAQVKDSTVFSVFNRRTAEQVALRIEPVGTDYDASCDHLDALHRRYNRAFIIGDGRGPGLYLGANYLRRRYGDGYLDVLLSADGEFGKATLVTKMRRLFQSLGWALLDVPRQKQEFADFKAFTPEPAGDGVASSTVKYGAPRGLHDDVVLAALYASIRLDRGIRGPYKVKSAPPRFSFEGIQQALERKRRDAGFDYFKMGQ